MDTNFYAKKITNAFLRNKLILPSCVSGWLTKKLHVKYEITRKKSDKVYDTQSLASFFQYLSSDKPNNSGKRTLQEAFDRSLKSKEIFGLKCINKT